MGADISMKTIDFEGKTIALQLWDFNGEERFKALLPVYARGSAGGILMYDITRKESLEKAYDWLIIFKNSVIEGNINVPIILVGGKLDLYERRAVSFDSASSFGQINKLTDYIECSSKTGQNVDLVFNMIVNDILKSRGFLS
jgi:Ras-related protein Rab-2A